MSKSRADPAPGWIDPACALAWQVHCRGLVHVAGWLIPLLLIAGCRADQPPRSRPPPGPAVGRVEIHIPERLTSVPTGRTDALGKPERAACVSCHSLRPDAPLPTSTSELDEFHQGLRFEHGALPCAACHVEGDQDQLHLADGSKIAMRDALELCAQCHGPQLRDYRHGAHGGMSGHWDLSVGGRTRNHCVDCHDPHLPAFQPSQPVLRPQDHGVVNARSEASQ